MPTRLNVTQQFDAPPATVYGLLSDEAFQQGRLDEVGGLEAQVVSMDSTDDGVQDRDPAERFPASVLPSMVASMMPGDPATERIEDWHVDGDGYSADFSVTVKGAPASLKGTMTLPPGRGRFDAHRRRARPPCRSRCSAPRSRPSSSSRSAQLLEAEADYTQSRLSA